MKKSRISESTPIQVYLAPEERTRLDRLADQLNTSRSDILRRGIRAVEREVTDPEAHPTLRLIGLSESAELGLRYDPAAEHDRFLADTEENSWSAPAKKPTSCGWFAKPPTHRAEH